VVTGATMAAAALLRATATPTALGAPTPTPTPTLPTNPTPWYGSPLYTTHCPYAIVLPPCEASGFDEDTLEAPPDDPSDGLQSACGHGAGTPTTSPWPPPFTPWPSGAPTVAPARTAPPMAPWPTEPGVATCAPSATPTPTPTPDAGPCSTVSFASEQTTICVSDSFVSPCEWYVYVPTQLMLQCESTNTYPAYDSYSISIRAVTDQEMTGEMRVVLDATQVVPMTMEPPAAGTPGVWHATVTCLEGQPNEYLFQWYQTTGTGNVSATSITACCSVCCPCEQQCE